MTDATSPAASATDAPAHLPTLPDDDWSRVLCVVAHPDDMEYGASAAVADWTRRGIEVSYLLLTSGEAGMQLPPEQVGPLRAKEQERACATVGVRDLRILDHPDGMLMPTLELRRDIARVIRQVQPDAVVTANFDFEAYGGLNQADHRAAGVATIDAVRDADNTWVFRDLADAEGLSKWHTRWILVAGSPEPTYAVPVNAADVAASVASLECHAAYLADLPGHPVPAEFIPAILAQGGQAAGVEHAVLFKAYDLGPGMRAEADPTESED
jgi:LmbE family N-acetylglucosaminyl deacetylase